MAGLPKLHSTCPEEHFSIFFKSFTFSDFFFDFERSTFWTSNDYFLTELSKLFSTCPEEHFEGKNIFFPKLLQSPPNFSLVCAR